MKQKYQLIIIITILAIKIIVPVSIVYIFHAAPLFNFLNYFNGITSIVIILYLYKFTKIDKGIKIYFFPFILMTLYEIYSTLIIFFPITDEEGNFPFLFYSFPVIIYYTCQAILGVQLFINNADQKIKKYLKFLGIAFLIEVSIESITSLLAIFSIRIPPDFIELASWIFQFFSMISYLQLIAMFILYWVELRTINSQKNVRW